MVESLAERRQGIVSHFLDVCAVIVWVVGSARITRLICFDAYPPAMWLRMKWDERTIQSDWNKLLHCGYCAAPWISLLTGIVSLALLPVSVPFSHAATWFWLIGGWLAGAYAAAVVVAYDGDD